MAKVITVSQYFPKGHINAGKKTWFKEMIWGSLYNQGLDLSAFIKYPETYMQNNWFDRSPKEHTIRIVKPGGKRRWKTGDMASIRVWGNDINPKSGRCGPYHSKQIVIAPDVEVTVFDIVIECDKNFIQPMLLTDREDMWQLLSSGQVASNDGLSLDDFKSWFNPKGKTKTIEAQIICWNKNIKY